MATPSLRPANSFSSSDRSFSNASEYSVDTNSYNSIHHKGDMDSASSSQLQNSSGESSETTYFYPLQEEEIRNSYNSQGANGGTLFYQEGESLDNYPMEVEIWDPPEPQNPRDEEPSQPNNDNGENKEYNDGEDEDDEDDDEDGKCCDDMELGEVIALTDGKSESSKLKAGKQREMLAVVRSKFRNIVNQLIRSMGVSPSTANGENWVDVVSSLSWEAASLLQKVVLEGKPFDPNAYVKVKCIATGSPSQSQVVRGLVFKKRAAHKHMRTQFKKPRLLLVQGVLGESSSGLSSFASMKEEEAHTKDYANTIFNRIKMCRPNVVLVEKSVSRDVQECFLKSKEITLVYDMKLHRLERVARCIGSQIVPFDEVNGQKLKKCDSFHIEKFIEEHATVAEGEKKPSKTLMFLEGCPTHLGCTVLLKGSHGSELKRIKEVVQSVVILAYHLILETYFLVDQQMMFSTIIPGVGAEVSARDQKPTSSKLPVPCFDDSTTQCGLLHTVDVPISNGIHEQSFHPGRESEDNDIEIGEFDGGSLFSEPFNSTFITGASRLSSALRNAVGDHFTGLLSTYLGMNGRHGEDPLGTVPIYMASDASNQFDVKAKHDTNGDKLFDDGKDQLSSGGDEVSVSLKPNDGSGEKESDRVLDSRSILVLMSRRNARKGTICEQSHFSHIMFYKNFDFPLGNFLQHNLFNQKNQCSTCEEPPEAHFYYYAHRNMQLTIKIKRLSDEKYLPGEAEGKLWMWSCCSKCKNRKGSSSTKRVLLSAAARGLSFGKFLELGFSKKALSGRLAGCGHSLDRDFIHFFGLGSVVAMFRYSQVSIYTVSLPPQKLEFSNSIKTGKLEKEFKDVFEKGLSLLEEIASFLSQIKSQFSNSTLNFIRSHKDLSDIEEMLEKERSEFEENLQNAFGDSKSPDGALRLLSLNRIRWELLVEACIWDRRFASLLLPDPSVFVATGNEKGLQEAKSNGVVLNGRPDFMNGCRDVAHCESGVEENDYAIKEIPIDGPSVQDRGGHERCTSNVPNNHKEQNLNSHFDGEDFVPDDSRLLGHQGVDKLDSATSGPENSHSVSNWFWLPFSSIRQWRITDLERNYLSTFEPICGSTLEHLTRAVEMMTEEGSRLHIPLGDDYHLLVDYEDEPSSLIACALARDSIFGAPGVSCMKSKSLDTNLDLRAKQSNNSFSREDSRFRSFDGLHLLELTNSPESLKREDSFGQSLGRNKYTVTMIYPDHFRNLRRNCCPSETDYVASLSRCKPWDAKGGKSKSFFAKTLDDRFIIKGIKKTEFDSFVKFAPHYFKYMNESFDQKNQTCLAKVLGIYQVVIRQSKSGREVRHELMVIENLGFGRNITRQYDLKGALYDRLNTATVAGDVLLDQNFVNDMNSSPLYVSNTSKHHLERAVWNDTGFLNTINVMDYSLLVSVDTERQELVCGIIDYLRQYTWDKQLETWVKSSLVVPRNVRPTIISPGDYKLRFRKFMARHFLSVPDDWCIRAISDTKDELSDRSEAETRGSSDDLSVIVSPS